VISVVACCDTFLKKITDEITSYHHFITTAIRQAYFGVSGGQWKKFARVLLSAHVGSYCSSHSFGLIYDDLFVVS